MTHDEILTSLQKYERNFEYIKNDILYPTLHLKARKELISIYNEAFNDNVKIAITCTSCMKPYVKALAKWYKEQTTPEPCKTTKAKIKCQPEIEEIEKTLEEVELIAHKEAEVVPVTVATDEPEVVELKVKKPRKPRTKKAK